MSFTPWQVLPAAVVSLSATLLVGCSFTPPTEPTSLAADPVLKRLLVTGDDFPGQNWTVADTTTQVIEKEATKPRTVSQVSPAECDDSAVVPKVGDAVATISGGVAGRPLAAVTLSRGDFGADGVARVNAWLATCGSYKVVSDGSRSTVGVDALPPPAGVSATQAGYRSTVTVDSVDGVPSSQFGGGELSSEIYVTSVGDITVTCISMGGKGWGGNDIAPDREALNAAYAAQVARLKAS